MPKLCLHLLPSSSPPLLPMPTISPSPPCHWPPSQHPFYLIPFLYSPSSSPSLPLPRSFLDCLPPSSLSSHWPDPPSSLPPSSFLLPNLPFSPLAGLLHPTPSRQPSSTTVVSSLVCCQVLVDMINLGI